MGVYVKLINWHNGLHGATFKKYLYPSIYYLLEILI